MQCEDCRIDFDAYIEAPDEGFGYAAKLYECNKCYCIFSHSIEDEQYLGTPQEKIKGKLCPECKAPLQETLEKSKIVGVCSNCGKHKAKPTKETVETYIEAYQIYKL